MNSVDSVLMHEPGSPNTIKRDVVVPAPKTPEKAGPVGEALPKAKALQKSPSMKGQLTFDSFTRSAQKKTERVTEKETDEFQAKLTPAQRSMSVAAQRDIAEVQEIEAQDVVQAIAALECGNKMLRQKLSDVSWRPPEASEQALAFFSNRHRTLTLLAESDAVINFKDTDTPLLGRAQQIAEDCLRNLTDPQYFELPENIAPIITFYVRVHPGVHYEAFQDTLQYLETCYEEEVLNGLQNYQELKRQVFKQR